MQTLLSILGIVGLIVTIVYTHKTLRMQTRTTRAQLRAYVLIDHAAMVNLTDVSKEPEAHVTIKNFGQTPAYKVINFTDIAFRPYPRPREKFRIERRRFWAANSNGSIGPGSHMIAIASTLGRPLTTEELAALADGTGVIYVFGEIRYVDTFRKRHSTKYRMMVGGPAGMRGEQLATYEEGNEAD